jgi:hypothetical protein
MIRKKRNQRGARRPVWPARPAAARLRRAYVGPILARPPIRAIQACIHPESGDFTITNSLAWWQQKLYEMINNTGWF